MPAHHVEKASYHVKLVNNKFQQIQNEADDLKNFVRFLQYIAA